MTLIYGHYVADPSDKQVQAILRNHRFKVLLSSTVAIAAFLAAYYGILFLLGAGADATPETEAGNISFVQTLTAGFLVFFASYRAGLFALCRAERSIDRRFDRAVAESRIVQVPGAVRIAWMQAKDQHEASGFAEVSDLTTASVLYSASTDPHILGVIQDMEGAGSDWRLQRNIRVWLDEKLGQLLQQHIHGDPTNDQAKPT